MKKAVEALEVHPSILTNGERTCATRYGLFQMDDANEHNRWRFKTKRFSRLKRNSDYMGNF